MHLWLCRTCLATRHFWIPSLRYVVVHINTGVPSRCTVWICLNLNPSLLRVVLSLSLNLDHYVVPIGRNMCLSLIKYVGAKYPGVLLSSIWHSQMYQRDRQTRLYTVPAQGCASSCY